MQTTKKNSPTSSKAKSSGTSSVRNTEIDSKLKSKLDQMDPTLSDKLSKSLFDLSDEVNRQSVLNDYYERLIYAAELDHSKLMQVITGAITYKNKVTEYSNADNVWAVGTVGHILSLIGQNKWFMEEELEKGEKRLKELMKLKRP